MTVPQLKEIEKIQDKVVRKAARKVQTFISLSVLETYKAVEINEYFNTIVDALKSKDVT